MRGVVSPYHLTTREAPALAALLLCEQVCTLVPAPAERAEAEALAERAGRYAKVVEAWRWTVPMWAEGVLTAEIDGCEPMAAVRAAQREIFEQPMWSGLRGVLEGRAYDEGEAAMEALAHDLLRGGPDPAMSVPVAAGLDRFAAQHGWLAVRSAAASVTQKFEEQAARPLAGVTVPIIVQGRAERVLEAREVLAEELEGLRAELSRAAACEADVAALRAAASAYRAAFAAQRDAFAETDEDEVRLIVGEASVKVVEMSADVVLEASERATRAMLRGRSGPGLVTAGGRAVSLIVKSLGAA